MPKIAKSHEVGLTTIMRNVLMIAYDFPPIGASGSLRTVKYAKYLSIFGWNPIILTVQRDARNIECADKSLLEELSGKVNVYRSRVIEPHDIYRLFGGRHKQFSRESSILNLSSEGPNFTKKLTNILGSFLVPDTKIGWYPGTIRKAEQVFNKHKIDVIYSTSPKKTSHIIARFLSRRYKKPWVADFRDPWPAYYLKRPSLLKRLDESLERIVLSEATRITIAWPGILEDIINRHKDFDKKKVTLITNGFDEDDLKGVTPLKFEHFTISYPGVFYRDRHPESLFEGLTLLFREKAELRKEIRILFIGMTDPILTNLINKYKLSDVVKHISYKTHRECIRYLLGSHLLFLNTLRNCVPGKLYEYLGLRKPIMALVGRNTMVAEIVRSTKAGIVIEPTDTEEVKESIMKLYEKYKKGILKLNRKDDSIIYQYERKRLTGKLAEIFNELTN